MSESSSSQIPETCRVEPCEHARLREQVLVLTQEDGLMEQVIQQAKVSNSLAKYNNKYLRLTIGLFVFAIALMLGVLGIVWTTLNDMAVMEEGIQGNTRRLSSTEHTINAIKNSTDKADEDRENQPRIELVTENDPKKAVEAPIKVRITPPVVPDPVSSSSTVEVPLPIKGVVKVPRVVVEVEDEFTKP